MVMSGTSNVGHGECLVRSDAGRALRCLAARLVSRSFSAQRHDSVPILACRLRQLERLACIEDLQQFCISASQCNAP